jgi:hypothetical protein
MRARIPALFIVAFALSIGAAAQVAVEYSGAAAGSAAAASRLGTKTGQVLSGTASGLNTATQGSSAGAQTPSSGSVGPAASPKVQVIESDAAQQRRLAATMQANRRKLTAAAGAKGATIHVASVPAQTLVSIDGAPIGYSPLDIRVVPGKHTITVDHPAFSPWRQEFTAEAHQELSFAPKLQLENNRTLFLSFEK